MKQCGAAAMETGASPGAVVSLKVDYCTHSHAQGLIAIVYAVKETGGILVCCDHGVITHSGSKGNYWVPVDKYSVVAAKDQNIPIPAGLQAVQELVLSGEYNPNNKKRILYSKYHEKCIDATSPIKRGKGCKCRNGKCGNSCGCKKMRLKCHSGCSCNGNCSC